MTSKPALSKTSVRTCLLYDYLSGLNARQSTLRLSAAFGPDSVSNSSAYRWFERFEAGDYSLKDEPRSGRPSEVDDDRLRQQVEADPRQNTRLLAETVGCSQTSVVTHLSTMGKKSMLSRWVPHDLTEYDRQRRINACTSLLSRSRRTDWLHTIVTGDEKWVLHINTSRKRQWVDIGSKPEPTPKPGMHPKKVMLSVWWDSQGVIFFQLLPPNTTINAVFYCNQLQQLADQLIIKRPRRSVKFLHDNARPHVARVTSQKMQDLGWEVLPHPPYSPDIAPSDYHLFRRLDSHLKGKSFTSDHDVEAELIQFFRSLPSQFYRSGIEKLPDRWRQIIACDGAYPDF